MRPALRVIGLIACVVVLAVVFLLLLRGVSSWVYA